MKDGSLLDIDGTTYSMEQTVQDAGRPTSTYDNVLTIVDSGSRFGTYSCEVSNALGFSGPTSVTIPGQYIVKFHVDMLCVYPNGRTQQQSKGFLWPVQGCATKLSPCG